MSQFTIIAQEKSEADILNEFLPLITPVLDVMEVNHFTVEKNGILIDPDRYNRKIVPASSNPINEIFLLDNQKNAVTSCQTLILTDRDLIIASSITVVQAYSVRNLKGVPQRLLACAEGRS